jgi:hypothetical protein
MVTQAMNQRVSWLTALAATLTLGCGGMIAADHGTPDGSLPCCEAGQGWGGLPTTWSPTCAGCCPGLSQRSTLVGPDLAESCVSAKDGGNQ